MPNSREHLARARQNITFAQSFDLANTLYLDWVATAYFYAALHLVDALLYEKDKLHGGLHEERKEFVRAKDYLRGIKDEYRSLKDLSEDARYRLITMTSFTIKNKIIPRYQSIENHILSQLWTTKKYTLETEKQRDGTWKQLSMTGPVYELRVD